jgi:Flp pilus assembly protein TadD
VHGSFVACVLLADYEEAFRIADAGLHANPKEYTLLNNAAVSLAKNGDVQAARDYFSRIDAGSLTPANHLVWRASAGLLDFRAGDLAGGRANYLAAIDQPGGQDLGVLRARAALDLPPGVRQTVKTQLAVR